MKQAVLVALAACAAHPAPKAATPATPGVTISIYAGDKAGYSVVDDRRWVDIKGSSILLANIDPGAELASLEIEPLTSALEIGTCTRDRLPGLVFTGDELTPSIEADLFKRRVPFAVRAKKGGGPALKEARYAPVVRCDVKASPGRYLLRVLYASPTLQYHAQHDVDIRTPTRATVSSRFALETPPWRTRADVILYDGVPGSEHAPTEVTRGSIDLDGTTAIMAVADREVAAEVRRIYDGAVITTQDTHDAMWGHDSVPVVWVWLELAALHLAPGPVHVHLDLPDEGVRDADVAIDRRKQSDEALRLPLWIDSDLRGMRSRIAEYNDGSVLSERFVFGVANTGEVGREVFVDEHLRSAKHRRLERAWPKKPVAAPDDVLRTKLSVGPGRVVRAGYTLSYEF